MSTTMTLQPFRPVNGAARPTSVRWRLPAIGLLILDSILGTVLQRAGAAERIEIPPSAVALPGTTEIIRVLVRDEQFNPVANAEVTIRVTAPGTDLRLSVEGRSWVNSDGKRNFPSGSTRARTFPATGCRSSTSRISQNRLCSLASRDGATPIAIRLAEADEVDNYVELHRIRGLAWEARELR